ncbi:hypothetical protein Tbd_2405 [Thiobacillus denitrificans ATCC 25259]|uniref:Uncharacterized protein n=1 Tax=Thiobacillus denitrificans (strain ATCC 25259 / T1) TaxID=292415 RepID=Q3SG92_THIDA|nr:hypothetical protein Tbd_2405 [Thiobacillus denitrificans ATCC 25259]
MRLRGMIWRPRSDPAARVAASFYTPRPASEWAVVRTGHLCHSVFPSFESCCVVPCWEAAQAPSTARPDRKSSRKDIVARLAPLRTQRSDYAQGYLFSRALVAVIPSAGCGNGIR